MHCQKRMETFKNVKVDNKSVSPTLPRGVICEGLLERLRGTGTADAG